MLWLNNQLSFNHNHKNIDNIYRVRSDVKLGEMEGKGYSTTAPMAKANPVKALKYY